MTSKLILGTVQLGVDYGINNKSGKPAQNVAFDILKLAYESGIDTLDTAVAYGTSQEVIGNFHATTGKRFKVISKLNSFNKDQPDISTQLKRILSELHIDHLEAGMVHQFNNYMEHPAILEELSRAKESGMIRKIGISVYTNSEIDIVCNDKRIDIVQMPFNLLDNRAQRNKAMIKLKQAGKEIHVRSVFLQGLFFKTTFTGDEKFAPLAPYIEKINALCHENGTNVSDLALHYALNNELIDKVLIGVETIAQLKENLHSIKKTIQHNQLNTIDSIQVSETELLNPGNWK